MFAKKATPEDFEQFYTLRADEHNIYWSGHENAPEREKLKAWFAKNLVNETRTIFLFFAEEDQQQVVGYLYLDKLSETEGEVAYGVLMGQNGKGYGTLINRHAVEYTKSQFPAIKTLYAWIAADNVGSVKCVEKNGYRNNGTTKHVPFPKGDSKLFEQFQLDLSA